MVTYLKRNIKNKYFKKTILDLEIGNLRVGGNPRAGTKPISRQVAREPLTLRLETRPPPLNLAEGRLERQRGDQIALQ